MFGEETTEVSETPGEESAIVDEDEMDEMIMNLELIDGDEIYLNFMWNIYVMEKVDLLKEMVNFCACI